MQTALRLPGFFDEVIQMAVVSPGQFASPSMGQGNPYYYAAAIGGAQGGVEGQHAAGELMLSPSRASGNARKRGVVLASAGMIVLLSLILAVTLIPDPDFGQLSDSTPTMDGLTIFAVFFVAAFSIERLLEPAAALLLPKEEAIDDLSQALAQAKNSTTRFYAALSKQNSAVSTAQYARNGHYLGILPAFQGLGGPGGQLGSAEAGREQGPDEQRRQAEAARAAEEQADQAVHVATEEVAQAHKEAQSQLQEAAIALAAFQDRDYLRTVIFWAMATTVAMLASASLHLYFLRTVGVSSAARWLEILATGLIIGAGTKPLHDLTAALSARKGQIPG